MRQSRLLCPKRSSVSMACVGLAVIVGPAFVPALSSERYRPSSKQRGDGEYEHDEPVDMHQFSSLNSAVPDKNNSTASASIATARKNPNRVSVGSEKTRVTVPIRPAANKVWQ